MTKLSHIVIPVGDLQSSRDWYVEKLGFTLEDERGDIVRIRDAGGLTISLQEAGGSLASAKVTLTIEVENVDKSFQELKSAGVQFLNPPRVLFWGYGAEVLDPDGYMNRLWDRESMNKDTERRVRETR